MTTCIAKPKTQPPLRNRRRFSRWAKHFAPSPSNAGGRESSQTWVGGNYTANYGYNAAGELTSASDPFSTYTYTYDSLGDTTSVSNAGTPGVPTVTLSYTFDAVGDRLSLSDSLGGSLTYGYNLNQQLTSLGTSFGAEVTMAYDAAGRLTGLTRGLGGMVSQGYDTISTSLSYDKANELTNITHTDATTNTQLASYTYGYNASGDLTSYQDNGGNSLTYGYDANGELTSGAGTLAGSNYSVNYSYDLNGNRTMPGYQTGTGNELLSDGTYNYTYDKNGNTLTQTNIATGSVTYYTWDFENRLTEVKVENSQGQVLNDETFTYDMFGNRIGVSLNGTQQLYTVYDGSNPYMDFNGSGQLTQRYLTNPNALSQYYGQVSASGTTQWFLTDNLNSIRQVISTSGSSLDAITFDPYGNIVSQTNSANAPRMGFAGGTEDSVTGNVQFNARPYRPVDGWWLKEDPLGFTAGDANLYRYVYNSPVGITDSTGLQSAPPRPPLLLPIQINNTSDMTGGWTPGRYPLLPPILFGGSLPLPPAAFAPPPSLSLSLGASTNINSPVIPRGREPSPGDDELSGFRGHGAASFEKIDGDFMYNGLRYDFNKFLHGRWRVCPPTIRPSQERPPWEFPRRGEGR